LATRSLLAAARLSRLLVAVALVTLAVATVLGTPAFVTLGGTALALCNRTSAHADLYWARRQE